MEAPLETPLAALLPEVIAERLRSSSWPEGFAVHHGDPQRLPAWMRRPEIFEPRELRRLCPFADVSVTHAGAHFQAILPDAGPSAIDLLLRSDLTLSLSGVADAIPDARAWLDALADELAVARAEVDAALFLSSSGQGLPCHFDAYDALVVQLHGSKRWRVSRAPAVAAPVDRQYAPGTSPTTFHAAIMPAGLPESDPADLAAVDLVPGSVLFVPRGTWHTTAASERLSVSASIFLNVPSIGALLLGQLGQVIAQDPRLRAPARGFAGGAAARAFAGEHFAEAARLLGGSLGALGVQAAFEAAAAPDRLAEVVSDATRFIRDPSRELRAEAASADGVRRLRVVDTARARPDVAPRPDLLVLPDVAAPLVTWIADRRGVFPAAAVREAFPAFDGASVARLLAELVRVGILVLLPFGPLSPPPSE